MTTLETDEDIFNYIKAVIQESDPENIIKAIQEVAKIKGYNNLAEKMGIGRESLYKAEGILGLYHKSRNKPSNNRTDETKKEH